MRYEPLAIFIGKYQAILKQNDFDRWNTLMKKIDLSKHGGACKPRAVWWCLLGFNIGHEQNGNRESFERPVLILKIFHNDTFLCVPLSTSGQRHPFCVKLNFHGKIVYAITSQVRILSTKRLVREMVTVSPEDFKLVKGKLRWMLN